MDAFWVGCAARLGITLTTGNPTLPLISTNSFWLEGENLIVTSLLKTLVGISNLLVDPVEAEIKDEDWTLTTPGWVRGVVVLGR